MIDLKYDNIYNIALSIFLGIIIVVLLHNMFTHPRIANVYKDE